MATYQSPHRIAPSQFPPRRSAPFEEEPGYYPEAGLWLYGNVRLLDSHLSHVPDALGQPNHTRNQLEALERQTEVLVLKPRTIVTGIHNECHRRVATVPLRWGASRVLVLSGGFHYHLGPDLKEEPFPAARLWRFKFDARTDLVISRRAPDRLPTYANYNPSVDKLVQKIAGRTIPGLLFRVMFA